MWLTCGYVTGRASKGSKRRKDSRRRNLAGKEGSQDEHGASSHYKRLASPFAGNTQRVRKGLSTSGSGLGGRITPLPSDVPVHAGLAGKWAVGAPTDRLELRGGSACQPAGGGSRQRGTAEQMTAGLLGRLGPRSQRVRSYRAKQGGPVEKSHDSFDRPFKARVRTKMWRCSVTVYERMAIK